jgi:hypothetical protein
MMITATELIVLYVLAVDTIIAKAEDMAQVLLKVFNFML